MRILALSLVLAGALVAQPSRGTVPPPTTLSNAAIGGERIESRELLSTTSQRICSRSTIDSSRTSATVLAIAANASATVPEYIRFGLGNGLVTGATTTATLSGGGAADVGTVYLYARLSGTTTTIYVGHNLPGATITCAGSPGCTVQTGITGFPRDATALYSWQVSNANWTASTGIDAGTQGTCWIDLLTFTNTTGSSCTVTLSDAQTSPLGFLSAVSIAANSTSVIALPGGARFDGGATWLAGSNSCINGYVRWAKQ